MPAKGQIDKTKYISFICEHCGKESSMRRIYYQRHKHHFCNRECSDLWQQSSRLKENNPYWKGGKTYDYPHSGKIKLHKKVMEEYLGRKLLPEEEIHHIDENPKNNQIENLLLCKNRLEHRQFHHKK